ncbi:MAG TPA: hypothetical protein VEL76_34370 [Gemmataceae bacterium]|nr:hypothetical protein [Gemmataceae bacterium]
MGRLLFCSLALVGSEFLTVPATAQPALPGPMRVQESKPVTVKDAEFVAVAQTHWAPPTPDRMFAPVVPLDIQLRITNLSKSAVRFHTGNTFGVKILKADGKEVKPRSGCSGTILTRPILLPGGASYSLWRRAELRRDEKTKASELVYYDGTGSQSIIGPLETGHYKLVFWYAVSTDRRTSPKSADVASWAGEVVTEEVPIELVEETTRGLPIDIAEKRAPQVQKVVNEVLRIRESKPVTVKDAKFVVVAESDWRLGKGDVPINIQLRITNVGKTDLLFRTFDTFGLSLLNADAKRIEPTGGRSGTIFTRPIVIPKGASYSLCRKAELRWNSGANASELFYWDGTGSEVVFGPLNPGHYNLSFWYSTSLNPRPRALLRPERQRGDPPTWFGQAVTSNVLIDLHDR